MYGQGNYPGCTDQLSRADDACLSAAERERADYLLAMSAAETSPENAMEALEKFLERDPASKYRMEVKTSIADRCFFNGEYALALDRYRQVETDALQADRREDYRYRKAYCLLMLADYDRARAEFETLQRSRRYGNAARFYKAYMAYAGEDYRKAAMLFREVDRTVAPGNMADYYLAQIYFMNEEYDKARKTALGLLSATVEKEYAAEANRIVGESYYNLGDIDRAIPYLQEYVASTETPLPSTLYILGVSRYRAGEYAEAMESFEPVTRFDNAMGQSAYLFIGQASLKTGNTEAALMAFGKALRMGFDKKAQETAFYNYAVARMQGSTIPFGSSVKTFEDFLDRYPDSPYAPQVREYIVTGYITDNDYESALQNIEKIRNPSAEILAAKQQVLYTLGTRDLASGNADRALARLREAKKLSAHNPRLAAETDLWIGECHYRQGRYEAAAESYLAYIDGAPEDAANLALAYYDLGYARFGGKRFDDALSAFAKATALSGSLRPETLADAYDRMGDCHYYSSRFDRAGEYYEKAYAANPATGDYPLYQRGIMKGLSRDHAGKIADMDEMLERFPQSGLAASALLEKAESYIELKENAKAIRTYRKLIGEYPATAQGRNGLLQLAITYLNAGERRRAVETYKEVITSYASSEEAKVAADDLKRLYAEEGDLQSFAAFINSVPDAPGIDASEMDQLAYDAAEQAFLEGKGTTMLESYLSQYPQGRSRAGALTRLAAESLDRGKLSDALKYATEVVERYPDTEAAEEALAVKAQIEYSQGKGEVALNSYRQLEKRASTSQNLNAARMGIMRVARDLGRHREVIEAAEALLSSSTVGAAQKNEITFTCANSLNSVGEAAEAEKLWASLASETDDLYGAKSAVYLGQHYYDKGDLKDARKTVEAFVDSQTPHEYWLARGFILLSDINRKEGKTFEANEYLRVLRENYPGREADIFRMIDERLK